MPVCNERFGSSLVPYFQPRITPVDDGHWYLAEDSAFCQRAREAGFAICADTTLRLWHLGTYPFGWEEAGIEPPRYLNFTLQFSPPPDSVSPAATRVPANDVGGPDDSQGERRRTDAWAGSTRATTFKSEIQNPK